MTNDTYQATDHSLEWRGPEPDQDDAPTELDQLIRALHEHAKALAELQSALLAVRKRLQGDDDLRC